MADDPLELEKKLRENAELMAEARRKLDEQPLDMSKIDQLQDDRKLLIEKRKQLNERLRKAAAGNED